MKETRFEQVKKIEELKAQGSTVVAACKQVGITVNAYYSAKASKKKSAPKRMRRKPQALTIELPMENMPFVFIMGSSSDVASALDRVARIQGRSS